MNFRYLLLAAVLGLSACNGSDTSTNKKKADSTFSDLANAKAELEKVNAQKEAGEKHKIVLADEIAALEARQKELKSAIETAKAELDRLQGEDGKGGEIAAQRAHLADLISQADRKVADIETAKQTLVRLGSIEDKSGEIGDAKSSYDKLAEDTETKTEELNKATKLLEKLQGNDGKGGSIKEARDRLIALEGENGKGGSIKIATDSLAGLAAKLAILNGKGEGSIFEAQEKLKELKGDGSTGNPGAIALAQNELEERRTALLDLTGDGTDKNPGEIAKATKELVDLVGEDGKGGKVANARNTLAEFEDQITTASEKLKSTREALDKLQGKDGSGGDIATARKTLETLSADIETAEDKLAAAQEAWKKLAGEDGKGGEIALEQKKLDELIRLAADKAEEIRKAGLELERIKHEGKAITDKATLDAARILSQAAFDAGRFDDAGKFLTDVGLNDEAIELYKKAGKIDKAAALLTAAGKLEDAYKLYAPEDRVKEDKNAYKSHSYTAVAFDKVDEIPAVKRHSIQLDGKTIWLTAKAGHLIAYAQKDKTNPEAKRDPQAAVFYMSYTRDDLPKDKRPVMFFFNGGPGEASIWMHLGGFAPKKIKLDQPTIPPNAATGRYLDFPFVDNADSLVDKADLVFVDPIGDGYSHAITSDIAQHKDKDFWGVDVDARVMRDFITRYINVNNRQSSPKYLYGESYAGGIRVPVLTKLLLDAGTSNYEEDKSGKPAVVLTGSVFHSPVLDYGSNCIDNTSHPCAGFFPTYVMTADALGQSTARGSRTITDYMQEVRKFAKETNLPATRKVLDKTFSAFSQTDDGKSYIKELERFTGLSNSWSNGININPTGFMAHLRPGYTFNSYDMRMIIKGKVPYKFSYMEDPAFHRRIKEYLPEYFNFKNDSYYEASLSETTGSFAWDWSSRGGQTKTNSLDDITKALNYAPDLKLMVTHGYFDGRTPTFQSELDLDKTVKINGKDVNLHDRIPLHNFEGGHMMYYVESELPKLKKTIVDFIDAPPYSPPTLVTEQKTTVLN